MEVYANLYTLEIPRATRAPFLVLALRARVSRFALEAGRGFWPRHIIPHN